MCDYIKVKGDQKVKTSSYKIKKLGGALLGVAQLVGVSAYNWKGCGFDLKSGRVPRLWVQILVWAHGRGNRWMFFSYINLSPPPPPHTSPLSNPKHVFR